MRRLSLSRWSGVAVLIAAIGSDRRVAGPMDLAADYLVANQNGSGYWGEAGFVGESTIGLCNAYEELGGASYKTAAESAGSYILSSAGYSAMTHTYTMPPFAAAAWALARLNMTSGSYWSTALIDFLNAARSRQGGTQGFIDGIIAQYGSTYRGTALYDLSRFCAAAGYVGDADVGVWRASIIDLLGDIDVDDDRDCGGHVGARDDGQPRRHGHLGQFRGSQRQDAGSASRSPRKLSGRRR